MQKEIKNGGEIKQQKKNNLRIKHEELKDKQKMQL